MLTAQKPSPWHKHYDISLDGRPIARWEPSWRASGGVFNLDGQRYEVRSSPLGSRFQLIGPAGEPLASAARVGRRQWTVQTGEGSYAFRRASIWQGDQELLLNGRAVGSIRRTSTWRRSAAADLPGMLPSTQVFVLCVVLAMWDAATTAANSAAVTNAAGV